MIKIKLVAEENFLKIAETLTRMGIANNRDKVLYQSCHILQKQGEYFITHFKEMMGLDGKQINLSEEDTIRTASIAKTLETWGLIEISQCVSLPETTNNFRVIKFNQKNEWKLLPKYKIGK